MAKMKKTEHHAVCKNTDYGHTFTKYFTSPYLQRKFIIKCQHSKRIKIIAHNYVWD